MHIHMYEQVGNNREITTDTDKVVSCNSSLFLTDLIFLHKIPDYDLIFFFASLVLEKFLVQLDKVCKNAWARVCSRELFCC